MSVISGAALDVQHKLKVPQRHPKVPAATPRPPISEPESEEVRLVTLGGLETYITQATEQKGPRTPTKPPLKPRAPYKPRAPPKAQRTTTAKRTKEKEADISSVPKRRRPSTSHTDEAPAQPVVKAKSAPKAKKAKEAKKGKKMVIEVDGRTYEAYELS
ncbi:uncharacterized protein BDZ99DRAFT_480519 [Mytilinidion resinicola]|uniref:Uncharacterized protein n=1 Tax=Mytilinidion resinicola TaxID=574789 RepID=A0A6A6YAS3_9PEZI|nr:uncharacterized protein BDZ99DRAFT_480519 [Mytilinidion resinicola]KAF2805104.1 hypothetical protein BDZ99DRAFT_480519 [Mytilinidion resinicola]